MAQLSLSAHIRENTGKSVARKLRREHQIPAVLYGQNREPVLLAVKNVDLQALLRGSEGQNVMLALKVESEKGTNETTVIIKELQIDPTRDTYLHADFHEINMDRELTVNVPVKLMGTPVGVTNGGVLQHIRRELEVSCLPDNLVDYLGIDVSGLDIGDSIHVRDFEFPEGIKSTLEEHLTVAVVAAPTVKVEAEEALEEGVEEEEAEAEEAAEETPEEAPAD
jgi:large subunit ribosomal protein L25